MKLLRSMIALTAILTTAMLFVNGNADAKEDAKLHWKRVEGVSVQNSHGIWDNNSGYRTTLKPGCEYTAVVDFASIPEHLAAIIVYRLEGNEWVKCKTEFSEGPSKKITFSDKFDKATTLLFTGWATGPNGRISKGLERSSEVGTTPSRDNHQMGFRSFSRMEFTGSTLKFKSNYYPAITLTVTAK